jgi:hypothetical protein
LDAGSIACNLGAVLNRFDYLRDVPGGRFARVALSVLAASFALAMVVFERGQMPLAPSHIGTTTHHALRKPSRSIVMHRKVSPAATAASSPFADRRNVGRTPAPARKTSAAARIRAIGLGESPKVLVEIGGRTSTVGLGSSLEGNVVTEIDSSGLLLGDGERLRFSDWQRWVGASKRTSQPWLR